MTLIEKKMEHTVGAVNFLGLGQKSLTEVIMKQIDYFPGDQIKLSISSDNSKCKNAVKKFKFKLYRSITIRDPANG